MDQALSRDIGDLNARAARNGHCADDASRLASIAGIVVIEGIRPAGMCTVAESGEESRPPISKGECIGPEDPPRQCMQTPSKAKADNN